MLERGWTVLNGNEAGDIGALWNLNPKDAAVRLLRLVIFPQTRPQTRRFPSHRLRPFLGRSRRFFRRHLGQSNIP